MWWSIALARRIRLFNKRKTAFISRHNNEVYCGLELGSLLNFTPSSLKEGGNAEHKKDILSCFKDIGGAVYVDSTAKLHLPQLSLVDMSSVDALIVTNCYNMLALPYITEYTNFKGKIYATEPTIQLGSLLMHELVNYHNVFSNPEVHGWQKIEHLKILGGYQERASHYTQWRSIYTARDVDNAIAKVFPVSFLQEINLLGLLTVIPVSSGFCIGSANLVFKTPYEKIVYISQTSGVARHPEPFDATLLKAPHTLILTQMQPNIPPKPLESAFTEVNILDLLEYVDSYLASTGMRQVSQYYVSPVSETVLAYADILPEWLCKHKQDRVYLPEPPFIHSDMLKTATLTQMQNISSNFCTPPQKTKLLKNLNSLKEPRIIYMGHPSCRFGDIVQFIQAIGSNPKNTIILIEPDYDPVVTLAPFQPLLCKVLHIPLDPRLNAQEAQLLVNELHPQHLIVPKSHDVLASSAPQGCVVSFLVNQEVLSIPVAQRFERAFITKDLSQQLQPQAVSGSSDMVASMVASLADWNHTLTLSAPTTDIHYLGILHVLLDFNINGLSKASAMRTLWGSPTVEGIVDYLSKRGITNIEVIQDKADFSIVIFEPDANPTEQHKGIIKLSQSTTKITTNDELLRATLTEAILSQCTFFNKLE